MTKRDSKWLPGEALFIARAEMTTVEDSYEEGEIGREMLVWHNWSGLWPRSNIGPFYSYDEVIEQLAEVPGAPKAKSAWAIYDDDEGRIEASWLVNNENYPAERDEIAAWQKRKIKLWSARLSVWLIAARIHGAPKTATIEAATGFERV